MRLTSYGSSPIPGRATLFRIALVMMLATSPDAIVEASHYTTGGRPAPAQKGAEALLKLQTPARAPALGCERDVPLLRALGEACDALPIRSWWLPTTRDGKDCRVAVHQLGFGTNEDLLIFIHGVMADHETWRYVAGALGTGCDLWLVDLPGCGASEAPNPVAMGPDAYSPVALADRVLQALEQCEARADRANWGSRRITLVGHSLGGTVCLRMFSDPVLRQQHHAWLRRIGGLALLAPCDVGVHAEIPIFVQVIQLKDWMAGVGHALGIVEARITEGTRHGYHVRDCATDEQAQRLIHILTKGELRHAQQAMLRQAVPWNTKEGRPDWLAVDRLAANYRNIEVPCLIVWGDWDEVLPASMGHAIKDAIPDARLLKLNACGHSLPTEKPVECAQILLQFAHLIQTNAFLSVPPVSHYAEASFTFPGQAPAARLVAERRTKNEADSRDE